MNRVLLETLAAAPLVASEAFLIGFGSVWMTLGYMFEFEAWKWPATVVGAVAAIWSVTVIYHLAKRAPAADAAYIAANDPD